MTAIIAVSLSGLGTARRISGALEARLHARHPAADVVITELGPHLRGVFRSGEPVVFVGAIGALVRMLAPVIDDKRTDPPVVAVADDASAVVPVLGGHHGANELAARIGDVLGVSPAITTASDLVLGVALDAPPSGWHLAPAPSYAAVTSRLLAGEAVSVDPELAWLDAAKLNRRDGAVLTLRAGHRAEPAPADGLLYHPEVLAVGVGCVRAADPAELVALVRTTLARNTLAPDSAALVASIDLKMDEPAVHAAADALGRPARFFPPERLERETPRLATPSDVVFAAVGTHGVAEAAALAAAGDEARLIVPKQRSANATCAVAIAPGVIDPARTGQGRGRLFVVGTGPGAADWRTAQTDRLVGASSDLVGYDLYLDLLGPLAAGKRCHRFPLGAERERVVAALELAAGGSTVALVSSGDPGVYAMASLVFETLDHAGREDWRRIAVEVAPGISAAFACAARIGAPLGHDFCMISLSDLLTARDVILARLRAAAEGDFVVALYNPASSRRRDLLARAIEILAASRPPDTPVVHGRSIGRPEERIEVTGLAGFDPSDVDMLSLLLVGNSRTRTVGGHVYTPRGYSVEGTTS